MKMNGLLVQMNYVSIPLGVSIVTFMVTSENATKNFNRHNNKFLVIFSWSLYYLL